MEHKRPTKIFRVEGVSLPIPTPKPQKPDERAKKRLEMLSKGMMPIPIGLENADLQTLAKLGITGVEYSPSYNERFIPISTHNHE